MKIKNKKWKIMEKQVNNKKIKLENIGNFCNHKKWKILEINQKNRNNTKMENNGKMKLELTSFKLTNKSLKK